MRRLLLIIILLLVAAYPFAIYFGLHYLSPRYLALVIMFVFLVRFILMRHQVTKLSQIASVSITLIGIALCFMALISNHVLTIRLYPFFINATFFLVFSYSLVFPPTVIERLARLSDPNLPPKAIHYTRQVNYVWTLFFMLNGAVALWTALAEPLNVWTFYNGFVSYIVIALIFTGEFIVRMTLKHKLANT